MNELIQLLQSSPGVAIFFLLVAGLLVGSFLNVVIYRLPLMIENELTEQCQLLSNTQESSVFDPATAEKSFNLAWPNSHCPHCKAPIKAWQNIPLISYLLLKGRCQQCNARISLQYPLTEIASALLAVISWTLFGFSATGVALFGVGLVLLALSIIDLKTFLLPDRLTLPLLWAGLIYQTLYQPDNISEAIWGAALGYLVLWLIYWLFKLVTGKEGMGYGDFKLLAALGAWLGVSLLPAMLLMSALSGLIIGLAYKAFNQGHEGGIPFGPALALSGWFCLAFPDTVRTIMVQIFL